MLGVKSTHEVRRLDPDARQQAAVAHVHGPMLVVAGAGTGKTTVLTQRIVRLIREGHARADEVLALTYTNNAARLMRERVQAELQDPAGELQTLTFHAYCDHLLERTGRKFGVLDEKDLWIYLRRRLHELPRTHYVRAANVGQFLGDLLDFMRRCHDELVSPERYASYVEKLERGEIVAPRTVKSKKAAALTHEEAVARCREIRDVFMTVERMLREENLGTFAHMITGAYQLFRDNPELLASERQHVRFILVDEFQDANFAQIKILKQLGGEAGNVFAVGDPDQAIYRFRGASSAAFEFFRREFPNSATVVLDRNRRSTTPILKCAFAVIDKNPDVFAHGSGTNLSREPLISAREESAKREGREFPSAAVQAVVLEGKVAAVEAPEVVGAIIEQQRRTRCPWSDFAVLYRTHSHRDQIARELAERGIPFSIEAMDVLDTPEVRDLLACVGAVVSTSNDADLFRVAALPQFTIEPNELRAGIRALPRDAGQGSLAAVLAQVPGGIAVLEAVGQTGEQVSRQKAKGREALEIIVRRFDLDRGSPALRAVLDFTAEWEKKPITRTGEMSEFLEYLDHFREASGGIPLPSAPGNSVSLLTAHSAKGLEFKNVFMIRAVSPSFPSGYHEPLIDFPKELRDQDSLASDDDKTLNEQEERRLFYVAMTRACDSLAIYACKGRGKTDKTPPGFLRDLLKDPKLEPFLHKQEARGFQTDLFAQATSAEATGRIGEWVSLPAVSNLQATLSATAVERYNICPLQFKLEREWRIPAEVGAAAQYGAAMHRVLRAYHDSMRSGRPMTADALIELFRADLSRAGMQDEYQKSLYEKQGVAQLSEFLETAGRVPAREILHLEEQFKVKVGNTMVVGRIDRADRAGDQRVVITDYKTGRPRTQEDADESLQLSIYALAAREQWGYEAESLIFYNLEGNVPVITRRSELRLHEAKCEVEDVAANIAAGKFDPKPGIQCNFCAYRSLCPATERRIAFTLPTNSRNKKSQSASR